MVPAFKERANMRVRLVVDAEVDFCDDESAADYGIDRVRNCVCQAVENALRTTHEDGFDHDLCGDMAIFIADVRLVQD